MGYMDSFEKVTTFHDLPIDDFDAAAGLTKTATHACRLRVDWDDDKMESLFLARVDALLESPEIGSLRALVIGQWGDSGTSAQPIIDKLLARADRLTSLRAVLFGDIEQEECEVSWIQQGDHGPLMSKLPNLEVYVVRGGENLDFTECSSGSLRTLVVQTGGLPTNTIESILAAKLPAVRHLELWLGEEEYGFNGDIDTVRSLINGSAFAPLTYLGLRNSQIVDAIAAAFEGSARFGTLAELDLSNGVLSDTGGEALLANAGVHRLHKLDLHHHFMSEAVAAKLAALNLEVDVSDTQEADEDDGETYRYIAVGE